MKELFAFFLIYIIIFSFYMIYFFFRNIKIEKKKKIVRELVEVNYLVNRFKLDVTLIDYNKICRNIALINSFIFASVFVIMNLIDNFYIRFFTSFVLVFIFIYVLYGLLGNYYKNKE